MTLSSFNQPMSDEASDASSKWSSLYNSQLWTNSYLRKIKINKDIDPSLNVPKCEDTEDCHINNITNVNCPLDIHRSTCFVPNNHSTPNRRIDGNNKVLKNKNLRLNSAPVKTHQNDVNSNIEECNSNTNNQIPSISQRIDSNYRQKFSSSEVYCQRSSNNNRRLKKCGVRGVGCIVSLSVTESPIKKRTQIQACSITIMIMAIVIISLVLVNLTATKHIFTSYRYNTEVLSSVIVPRDTVENNTITNFVSTIESSTEILDTTVKSITTSVPNITTVVVTTQSNLMSEIISKIRKNIRAYPKDISNKPKEIINRDLSVHFCSCQIDEVCMLDEGTGTAMCKQAFDLTDPTGCGGLCKLETEACQLVDRSRGVRVCKLITSTTCSPEEWRCRNGFCVNASSRCDGTVNCYDKSDEINCACDLRSNFRCGHSISCFPNTKRCDGVIDCWDGFDEVNCTMECPDHLFTCTDGQCITQSRFCDGYPDCGDQSDEPAGCDGDCSVHEIRCRNNRCVSQHVQCDGVDHCGDATDEMFCNDNKH